MDPKRWTGFAPSMTKPATASPYMTIEVATVVGGTLKLATMPLSEIGGAVTWASAIAIIGAHDPRASVSAAMANSAVMSFHSHISCIAGYTSRLF